MGANAEYVRGWVEGWNRGDLEQFLDQAEPEVEWVVAREHPAARTLHGPNEVRDYIADWLDTVPGAQLEVEDIQESGDRVLLVMQMRGAGAGSGASTEVRVASVTTFRDGRPVRVEEFLDPAEAREALAAS